MKKIVMSIGFAVGMIFTVNAQEETKKPEFQQLEDSTVQATYYHADGEVRETGYFKNKKPHGNWIVYDNDGHIVTKASYDEGKRVGKWLFWQDDVLKEVTYVNQKIADVTTWVDKTSLADNE